jgi:MFS family permease
MTSETSSGSTAPSSLQSNMLRTLFLVVGFGCLIALMSFGPRSALGFFLTPLSSANHWGRDVFAFALALQNLLWGIGQPLAGMIADRFGHRGSMRRRAHVRTRLALMAHATNAPMLDLSAGALIGFGLSGCFVHGCAGGVRKAVAAAMALARFRIWHGGGLVRPVPVFAARGRCSWTNSAGSRRS